MKSLSKSSLLGMLALLCLLIAVPVTVLLIQQKQDLRQRARELTSSLMPSSSGNILLSGYVYHDANKNGEREQNEIPMKDVTIQILQANNAKNKFEVTTDTQGYFKYQLPWGNTNQSFFVKIIVLPGYIATTTNPLLFSDRKPGSKEIVEFGLFSEKKPLTSSPTATASAVPDCATRPACLDAVPRCLLNEPDTGWCPKVSPTQAVCKKSTTYARNKKTKRCDTFKNTCLPNGWVIDTSCKPEIAPTI